MEFATSEADIAIYGGSAGGGKTFGLLYEPIGRELHKYRGFYGVIFRRSYPEITNPGGLWDEAGQIYPYAEGKPNVGAREYRFYRYGSRVAFRHLENEDSKYDYQGSQICYLAFDELTHFTESQFWYLLSRNRSTCGVRPYVRASCNPDPGWVKDFLAPWVDSEYPGKRAQSCELRWFVRVGGKITWCEPSHPDAKSLTFIRASIYDNPILIDKDPAYISTLKALPPVERARLLDGDWNVRRDGLVYQGFEDCIVDECNSKSQPEVGGIDFGFHNPFAAVSGYVDHDGVLWITGCRYKNQCTLPAHSAALPVDVEWWCDPSGAESIRQLRDAGHDARPCAHMPTRGASGERKNPKLSGIDMVSRRIANGTLRIVRCEETMPLIRELGMYHYDETKKLEEPVDEDNHACDALRYLIVGIDRHRMPFADHVEEFDKAEREAKIKAAMEQDETDRLTKKAADQAKERALFNNPQWGDQ